jgi:hypothetical protein
MASMSPRDSRDPASQRRRGEEAKRKEESAVAAAAAAAASIESEQRAGRDPTKRESERKGMLCCATPEVL